MSVLDNKEIPSSKDSILEASNLLSDSFEQKILCHSHIFDDKSISKNTKRKATKSQCEFEEEENSRRKKLKREVERISINVRELEKERRFLENRWDNKENKKKRLQKEIEKKDTQISVIANRLMNIRDEIENFQYECSPMLEYLENKD